MTVYRHTQPGVLLRLLLGTTALLFSFLGVGLARSEPAAPFWFGIVVFILLGALSLFHSLTVEVNTEVLKISFGPGLIRRTVAIADIERADTVRNRWYYGWGIRYTPHGWLFNVSGFDAVEVQFKNKRKFRIGTDDAEGLQGALSHAMAAVELERTKEPQ